MIRWLMSLALLLAPAAAQAKWFEASSDHFVIYADQLPSQIERFSRQLEQFHDAMTTLLARERSVPSPSNRLTIFVVGDDSQIRKLIGDGGRDTYAFYVPRAGGSLAFVPSIDARIGTPDFSMIALLHEYAHHFLLSAARNQFPPWFTEGSAEFFASASYERNGALVLGKPAVHRAGELLHLDNVTATQLLDPAALAKRTSRGGDSFYGKSWLLYHYLTFSTERSGQMARYLALLEQGEGSLEAGTTAFGDLAVLERDLDKYVRQSRMMTIRMPPGSMQASPVTLRPLRDGEAAIMPVRIRSRRGVTPEQAAALLPRAQAIAARFPADPVVLAALAEAEVDAGHPDAAIAAADRALALDAGEVNAYVQKGYALFRKAADAQDKAAAYAAARQPFQALNRIENDHPLPLIHYYLSFAEQGQAPPPIAVRALERAVELAPFDIWLRRMLALQQIRDKRFAEAAVNLGPIAYNPHGGAAAEKARLLLDRLNAGEELDETALAAIAAEDDASGEEGTGGAQ